MRVGNPRQISVDLRFVAATNRDLERMVDEGSFRRDLYYRLAVYPISVPPLRQRRTDIKTLTEYFISTKTKKMKLHLPPKLSHDEEDRLYLYHWPGNVRELEHVVERALINSRSGSTAGELHFDLPESGSRKHSPIEPFQGWPTLEELNSRYIDAVLEKTGRPPDRAERRRGASRHSLHHPARASETQIGFRAAVIQEYFVIETLREPNKTF